MATGPPRDGVGLAAVLPKIEGVAPAGVLAVFPKRPPVAGAAAVLPNKLPPVAGAGVFPKGEA